MDCETTHRFFTLELGESGIVKWKLVELAVSIVFAPAQSATTHSARPQFERNVYGQVRRQF